MLVNLLYRKRFLNLILIKIKGQYSSNKGRDVLYVEPNLT